MAKRPRRPNAKGPRVRTHRGVVPPARPASGKPAKSSAKGGGIPKGLTLDDLESVASVRELFWSNIIRELLVSLATASADESNADKSVFDGRLAVVTSLGERIPIADVKPIMGFGVNDAGLGKQLSAMLQCTVFQIRTPAGDVYTLPVHEIRGFHAMTEELLRQVETTTPGKDGEDEKPFGFAAFTSISRGIRDLPIQPAPTEPGE